MSCCRHGQRMVVPGKKINTNTLCTQCSLDLKKMYQLSAEQQTAGKAGEATVLVNLSCPRCATLNSYIITLKRTYDRSALKR